SLVADVWRRGQVRLQTQAATLLQNQQRFSSFMEQLQHSELRYRTLFNSIDEGYCIIEMLFDAAGQPVDYRFLEINPAFEKQTGLKNAQGKLMRDLAPQHEAHWFQIYGRIAQTGQPERFEARAEQL